MLQPALQTVWEWFEDKILPVLEEVRAFVADKIGPILEWFNKEVIKPLMTGIGGVVSVVEGLVSWLKDLAKTIRNLDLTKLLPFLGSSPSPLEMGIRGINSALREMSGLGLPTLTGSLSAASLAGSSSKVEETHNHWELRTVLPDAGDIPLRDWIRIQRTLSASAA